MTLKHESGFFEIIPLSARGCSDVEALVQRPLCGTVMTGRQLQRPSSIGTPIRPSAPATADLQKR